MEEVFPLVKIDKLVDAIVRMASQNTMKYPCPGQIKYMDNGTYGYQVMPFGLKNTRATFQRFAVKMFFKRIRSTVKVQVDGLLLKSLEENSVLDNFKTTISYGSTIRRGTGQSAPLGLPWENSWDT